MNDEIEVKTAAREALCTPAFTLLIAMLGAILVISILAGGPV